MARPPRPGLSPHGRRALRGGVRRARSGTGRRRIPRGMGINWASSLEVAFRLISWCWALSLFRGRPGCRRSGSRVSSRLSAPCRATSSATSPTTSRRTRTSPARRSGSSTRACSFPLCRGASRWRQLGGRILDARERAPDPSRRRVLGAIHVLPALHGRDLPALPRSGRQESASRSPTVSVSGSSRLLDALLVLLGPDRLLAPDRRLPTAAGSCRSTLRAPDDAARNLLDRGRRLRSRRLRLGGRRPRAGDALASGPRRPPRR